MNPLEVKSLELVDVSVLVPYARNAKKHSTAQVEAIAQSIQEFGFNNPVLVDASNTIIAGHGRVLAAQELGLAQVPCLRLTHLTDAQRRAYVLADNRLSEVGGGWDEELLRLEMTELESLGVDLNLAGFDPNDLRHLDQRLDWDSAFTVIEDNHDPKDAKACPHCGKNI